MNDAALRHTVGGAKALLKANLDISETLVFVPTQKRYARKCWGKDASNTLREILNCADETPLQLFTTCCDENLGDSASRLIGGQIHGAAQAHTISLENVEEVISIFITDKPISVHSTFGDFASKVKFF